MKNEYRVVTDRFAGYEAQIRRWWFPIWMQLDFVNTHLTQECAEKFCKEHAQNGKTVIVSNLGKLP